MKKVVVSDMTLKVSAEEHKKDFSFREKLSIAKNLYAIGVDVIELPYCANQKEDNVVYRTVAETVKDAVIAVNAGSTKEEIDVAFDCVKQAKAKRLQIALPVSVVQMEYAYHLKSPKMLEKIKSAVEYAVSTGAEVEFIAKDATRAEKGFLEEVAKTIESVGAKILTVCDDNGEGFAEDFINIIERIKSVSNIEIYVCPSDKIKMAPAILVECLKKGVDGIKTSTIGEYLSLVTASDILRAKGDALKINSSIDYTAIHKIAKDVAEISNSAVEEISGNYYKDSITLDGNCSIKVISDEISALGYELSVDDTGKVYEEFKRVCAKKGVIGERELEAIVASTAMQVPSTYHLGSYVVNSGNVISATANVTLEKEGEVLSGVSTGDGPIDAAFHAIEQIIGHHYELDDFSIQAVTKGREAVGSAVIRLRAGGKLYSGNGVSTDIVGACIRAYINALNKIVYSEN